LRKLGFSEAVAAGIYSLDEHWNGGGYPNGLLKQEIPLYACIANLAQTLEVFLMARGRKEAVEAARLRSGRWFNPDLVGATHSLCKSGKLWEDLEKEDLIESCAASGSAPRYWETRFRTPSWRNPGNLPPRNSLRCASIPSTPRKFFAAFPRSPISATTRRCTTSD
jgi:HD domain